MRYSMTLGAFGIVFDEKDKILLIHRRDADVWAMPGGGMEKGETPEETVVREIKEETGIEAEVSRLTGIYTKPEQDDIVFIFECKFVKGEIGPSDEADDVKYFNVNTLPKNIPSNHAERIKDALDNNSQPVFKIQPYSPNTSNKF